MKKNVGFIVSGILIVIWSLFTVSCYVNRQPEYQSNNINKLDPVKWEEFLKCSENEGDAGCDSCFFKVFGYYPEDVMVDR